MEFSVSSATVRNDMAELSERGLILQPHTSAGRIPSEIGYRLYIDKLLTPSQLTPQQTAYIDSALEQQADEPEHILTEAVRLLNEITGCAAAVTTPVSDDARVYKISFVRIGRHTAMLVLVASTGMVKTKLFRCEYVITDDIINIFEKLLNERLAGMLIEDIDRRFIQTMAASLGELGILLSEVLWSLMQTASEVGEIGILTGRSVGSLMRSGDYSTEEISEIIALVDSREKLSQLLTGLDSGVLIGSQTMQKELETSSVILSAYNACSESQGIIALIGPMRMNYSLAIPLLEYVASAAGRLITELIDINDK